MPHAAASGDEADSTCGMTAKEDKKTPARVGRESELILAQRWGHPSLASLSGRINEEPEWCFVRWLQFVQNLEELAHGVRPGHADILVPEHEEIAIPRPGLCLPRSAQVQLGWFLRADFPRSAHIALVIQRKRADHQQLVSSRKRVQNESEESWMPLL